MVEELDTETIAYAHRMFDLARVNDRDQTAFSAVVFRQSAETVRLLVAHRGA